jgi:flavodoxin
MKLTNIFKTIFCGGIILTLLVGCGTSTGSITNPDITPSDSITEESKVLVVYYSSTNNTKKVGDEIASTLNADVFQLIPVQPYSSADLIWSDSNSRTAKEHNDPTLRNVELVSATVENWDSYTTVFIGYPIWWGIAAWPVDTFVKNNDFTGKQVIPFCTSASSDFGQSGELLAQMANTGDWKQGQRFSSSSTTTEISEWAKSVMQ